MFLVVFFCVKQLSIWSYCFIRFCFYCILCVWFDSCFSVSINWFFALELHLDRMRGKRVKWNVDISVGSLFRQVCWLVSLLLKPNETNGEEHTCDQHAKHPNEHTFLFSFVEAFHLPNVDNVCTHNLVFIFISSLTNK